MKSFAKLVFIAVIVSMIGMGCGPSEQKTVSKQDEVQKEKPVDTLKRDEAMREKADLSKTQKSVSDVASLTKTDKMELTSDVAVKGGEEEKPKEGDVFKKTSGMDWRVTPEKRAVIEKEIPEAKGFVESAPIIEKIIAGDIKNKDERVKLFLEVAKDKYIYFAALTNPNPFNDNASLNIIFGEGALTPDFMMVQLRNPQNYDHQKYMSMYGGTGYVTAFVGKLGEKNGNLELDPVYDVFLPGYLR